jgi:cation:H+ antiporter
LFETFSIVINLLIFTGFAGSIWMAGTRLSYLIDAIAEQTNIARAFMGLVFLATATELPEMVTTITAASAGNGKLAINNMFGGMMLQLAVLAIAEMFIIKGTLSSMPRNTAVVVAGLLIIPSLSLLLLLSFTGDFALVAHMGVGSVLIAILYVLSMFILWKIEDRNTWSPVDLPNEQISHGEKRRNRYDDLPLRKLIIYSIIAGLIILFSGVFVVQVAETLAVQTGLGSSFIGVSLLALTTSMPELSTSIAAIRVKAYTMAIANIFGSNLIMTFLIFPVDLFFLEGPILDHIDLSASIALVSGIFLTAIYCIGLLTRPKVRIFGMGIDSMLVLFFYVISLIILYHVR